MRDIGEGWGVDNHVVDDGASKNTTRFCKRCQEFLMVLEDVTPICPKCRRPFVPNDPSTYFAQREFNIGLFWLPVIIVGAVLATVSTLLAFWAQQGALALLAFFPAPLGLIAGYLSRPKLLLVFQILVGGMFACAFCVASGTLWALPGAACAGVLTLLPVGMGYLLGQVICQLLQQSRWSQRFFLK